MLQAFRQKSPSVKIYLCYPVKINGERLNARDKVITKEVIPMINKVAGQVDAQVIDLHTPTENMPENFVDELHPNEQGAHTCKSYLQNTDRERNGSRNTAVPRSERKVERIRTV